MEFPACSYTLIARVTAVMIIVKFSDYVSFMLAVLAV
jgi:hypothetical protein